MDHIFPEELVKRIMDAARKENTRCPLSSEDCEKFYDHDQIQNTNNTIHKFDLQSLNKKVQKNMDEYEIPQWRKYDYKYRLHKYFLEKNIAYNHKVEISIPYRTFSSQNPLSIHRNNIKVLFHKMF